MLNYLYIIMAAMCIVVGFIFGYMTARRHDDYVFIIEKKNHEMEMRHEFERHAEQVAKNGLMFDIEKRELTKYHTRVLDEISQVTGIDKVELPSFGTIRLNQSKTVRETMRELYEEDYDELYSE